MIGVALRLAVRKTPPQPPCSYGKMASSLLQLSRTKASPLGLVLMNICVTSLESSPVLCRVQVVPPSVLRRMPSPGTPRSTVSLTPELGSTATARAGSKVSCVQLVPELALRKSPVSAAASKVVGGAGCEIAIRHTHPGL